MQKVDPNVEEIFSAALELESPAARSAYLDRVCGDTELRRRVERLLAHDAQAGDFLEAPVSSPTATVDQDSRVVVVEPGTAIGPYRLMEQIGEGGMGVVFVAEQHEPVRRRVALKLIKPGMDSRQVVARFEAERQALALMDHPNIAKVLDAGATESGRPYFVMELVRGVPITDYCDEQQLTIRERLDLFVLVCRAVQHAHQKGVIHRDLKPSNILVTLHDGVPVPKVIDFGVAKATGQSLTDRTVYTGFHQLVGTPLYMSPEQVEMSGLDVDTRSAIYSLGVLLYELLTGTTPFDSETLQRAAFDEMRRIIREEEPPRPSTRLSALGDQLTTASARRKADPRRLGASMKGELDWLVMKALEKDRRRRYETANDFASDVMRYLTDRPVEACPPSAWYRLGKFARRNRVMLTTTGVVSIALVTGTAVSIWQAIEANKSRTRAEKNLDLARKAVDGTVTNIAEEPRLKEADFHELRRSLLATAVPFYEEFTKQSGENPEVEAERGEAYRRLGDLRLELGEYEAVRADYEQMRSIFARLARMNPALPKYRQELAKAHVRSANLLRTLGRRQEAKNEYRAAIGLHGALVIEFPREPLYRRDLAVAHSTLGTLLAEMGRRESAATEYHAAQKLLKALLAEFPRSTDHRWNLAECHNDLGTLLKSQGKLTESEIELLGSRKLIEDLLAQDPHDVDFRKNLFASHVNLGGLRVDQKRWPEAEEEGRAAVRLIDGLVADFPRVPQYREWLAGSRYNLGMQFSNLGKRAEAEVEYRAALTLREALAGEFPAVPDYLVEIGWTYCQLGILKRMAGENGEAVVFYTKAIDALPQPRDDDAGPTRRRELLHEAYEGRARVLDRLVRSQATFCEMGSSRSQP